MPKYRCRCGYDIDLSNIPGEHEYMLVSEIDIEGFSKKCNRDAITLEQMYEFIDDVGTIFYKCPSCERLHERSKEKENGFNAYDTYVKESPVKEPPD